MGDIERPVVVISSSAPIRICDNGCWTDTWFAGHGAPRVVLHPVNLGESYEVRNEVAPWGPHPLLEATIALMKVPLDLRLKVTIHSAAPPGAGTGTSAAVTVALIGALDALTPGRLTPGEVAAAALHVETGMLGRQCGVQDQLASAHGGINLIDMRAYPAAVISPVDVPDAILSEFERRLLLIYLGKSHDSSAIHEEVIRARSAAGFDSEPQAEWRLGRVLPTPRPRGIRGPSGIRSSKGEIRELHLDGSSGISKVREERPIHGALSNQHAVLLEPCVSGDTMGLLPHAEHYNRVMSVLSEKPPQHQRTLPAIGTPP